MGLPPHAVETIVGDQARSYLARPNVPTDWDILYKRCTWSTPFQSYDFISTWYKLFKDSYTPILIIQIRDEKLIGALPLAMDSNGNLVYAGADIAEYQVWLADPMDSDNFIEQAILKIKSDYPGKTIPLKFVPSTAPLHWIKQNPSFKYSCEVISHKQPLLKINYSSIAKELKKKNRKEKLNRLKRLGDLQFVKITDSLEFDSILNELVIQSDFRKGAMFDQCMFISSTARRDFLSSLFKLNLLHVTILKLDNTIIASNVGVFGKKWVHLQGINTHSPMYAKYSPGILHFLMLGLMLSEEEIEVFDLTPGNNGYKEMLATDYIEAYEINFHTKSKFIFNKFKRQAKCFFQNYSQQVGISSYALKNITKRISIQNQKLKLIRNYKATIMNQATLKYHFPKTKKSLHRINRSSISSEEYVKLNFNSLSDLLRYNPKGTLQTRWEFLEDAMKRFEAGQQCYTWLENDSLLACAWLSHRNKSSSPATFKNQPQEGSYLLEQLYLHPNIYDQSDRIKASVLDKLLQTDQSAAVYTKIR